MIAVDTSALIAIVLDEDRADACIAALRTEPLLISAGTLAEALIVAGSRGFRDLMSSLIDELPFDIVDVTATMARSVADAYVRWGKGAHPASLNYGDCFAYALAKERDCPLLFIGNDFARTDVRLVL